ncbi:hypothetical protein [Undibacterium macrobrachii]|jgi:hypothetical protein|uniref:Uncharacterized protein n=1 Tax=Undibacterium macrobrachii TaxID=1119058 RepID=A0ABQ2XJ99_9BURK|nr:hypothetical protein [Undibacterium macrobrachii]GGX20411.1 hypothetical protein GCM10011282_28100 [Undibacterium macrobrachii]
MKTFTATAIVSAASACLTSLIFVGIVNVATTTEVEASVAPIQTVTVSAKRMSDEDKLAYDLELAQMTVSQVVEIRAKRLTAAEKAKMAAE